MEKGKGSASKSSSSSDGSNEPNSYQSPSSNFQRSQLTLESGVASFPVISMAQSQQGEASTVQPGGRMFQSLDIPEQDMNNARNQRGNNYQIPSNLPSLFRLDSSSRTAPTLQSPISTTSGRRSGFTQWSSRQCQHELPIHDPSAATFGFQNLLGQAPIGSNSYDPIQLQNKAIEKRTGLDMGLSLPPQLEGINPTDSNGKMKMTWEDNFPAIPNPYSLNLLSQGQGSQAQCYGFPFNRHFMRNTVYDPMYEAMGLPIDPHIRMFIARRDRDNGIFAKRMLCSWKSIDT
ncbi:hypothetical protein WN944_003433 [Citrus x changshan-huyou]|uniref:Uncharacterized protein n=1 Tax=Citrus x changshan-huyou TaxID=2935761 RepID=A0AAP0M1M3_9ROSI